MARSAASGRPRDTSGRIPGFMKWFGRIPGFVQFWVFETPALLLLK